MPNTPTPNQEQEKLARRIRHIIFAFFGGLAVLTSAVLLYEVSAGIQNGNAQNPIPQESAK